MAPGGCRRKKGSEEGAKSLFEEMVSDNFPNLGRDMNINLHKVHK